MGSTKLGPGWPAASARSASLSLPDTAQEASGACPCIRHRSCCGGRGGLPPDPRPTPGWSCVGAPWSASAGLPAVSAGPEFPFPDPLTADAAGPGSGLVVLSGSSPPWPASPSQSGSRMRAWPWVKKFWRRSETARAAHARRAGGKGEGSLLATARRRCMLRYSLSRTSSGTAKRGLGTPPGTVAALPCSGNACSPWEGGQGGEGRKQRERAGPGPALVRGPCADLGRRAP